MIDYIKGVISHRTPAYIVINVGGFGMRILTTTTSLEDFNVGDTATAYTELVVRDDSLTIVGFSTREELEAYLLLNLVTGVATKAALAILSSIPYNHLYQYIATQDTKQLQKAQGVGKKTAQRIVLELRDKVTPILTDLGDLDPISNSSTVTSSSADEDALSALISLGYTKSEANKLLSSVSGEELSVEEKIRAALRSVMQR